MKHILIAHQSGIPKYRHPFYETLQQMMPRDIDFCVVVPDRNSQFHHIYNKLAGHKISYSFKTVQVKSFSIKIMAKIIGGQFFLHLLKGTDLLVVEDAHHNLMYPIAFFLAKLMKIKVVLWGQGYDRTFNKRNLLKQAAKVIKQWQAKTCDGYFAYNVYSKKILVNKKIGDQKIAVINNTVHIDNNRQLFLKNTKQIKKNPKHLIFVGRLEPDKRIDVLVSLAETLKQIDPAYCIHIVGDGPQKGYAQSSYVSYHGTIYDEKTLADLYMKASAYIILGAVGLGPIQALCYNLPVIAVNGLRHGPERYYLNKTNTLFLEPDDSVETMAEKIEALFNNPSEFRYLQNNSFNSIKHLTLENMATNFIKGIELALK